MDSNFADSSSLVAPGSIGQLPDRNAPSLLKSNVETLGFNSTDLVIAQSGSLVAGSPPESTSLEDVEFGTLDIRI